MAYTRQYESPVRKKKKKKTLMKNMTSFGLKAKEIWSADAHSAPGRYWEGSQ